MKIWSVAFFSGDRPDAIGSFHRSHVTGAFWLKTDGAGGPSLHLATPGGPLAGRWIVLIDDVVTTGASLAACAVPLIEAGAVGVSAITVARER